MKVHRVHSTVFAGSDFAEIYPQARKLYNRIAAQTKRQPYVKSAYFGKEKVFIELFWVHLNQKNPKERRKRLKYYGVGIELLRETRQQPVTKQKGAGLLHRFVGVTPDGDLFYVQVKENTKNGRKDLMSVFPAN